MDSIILAPPTAFPSIALSKEAQAAKVEALEKSALIARVTGHDSKVLAVRSQQSLKAVISAIEKSRVEMKEPALVYGRQVDTFAAAEKLELEKEFGRVSNAVREFDDAERRRVMEEERLQRLELERIEREKQAELKRISDELAAKEAEARRVQEEADRKAREAAAEAQRLASEAKNKKQREAAEAARQEALRQQALAEVERQKQAAETERSAAAAKAVEEKAADAAYIAAKPIEITKVAGQRTTSDWEITKINDFQLMRARPDLVRKIEFDLRAMKEELKRGVKLPGVEAKEVFKADVTAGKQREAINV